MRIYFGFLCFCLLYNVINRQAAAFKAAPDITSNRINNQNANLQLEDKVEDGFGRRFEEGR